MLLRDSTGRSTPPAHGAFPQSGRPRDTALTVKVLPNYFTTAAFSIAAMTARTAWGSVGHASMTAASSGSIGPDCSTSVADSAPGCWVHRPKSGGPAFAFSASLVQAAVQAAGGVVVSPCPATCADGSLLLDKLEVTGSSPVTPTLINPAEQGNVCKYTVTRIRATVSLSKEPPWRPWRHRGCPRRPSHTWA